MSYVIFKETLRKGLKPGVKTEGSGFKGSWLNECLDTVGGERGKLVDSANIQSLYSSLPVPWTLFDFFRSFGSAGWAGWTSPRDQRGRRKSI